MIIKTFNGFNLNTSSYQSAGLATKNPPAASPVFIEQARADSVYSGTYKVDVKYIPVQVTITTSANRHALEGQLKEALLPGTDGLLVVHFQDDGRDYQCHAVVQSITAEPQYRGVFTVIFQTGESTWTTVDPVTDTWSVTASGDQKELTVGGYSKTNLSLSITATGLPVGGWGWQQLYQVPAVNGVTAGLRPWCMTVDTAALITAGKMQADCDDILVYVDGKSVHRWIVSPNTTATKVWINLQMSEGKSMTLLTPVASSGTITRLYFQITANNKTALSKLPSRGYVQHGTEWFEYSGWITSSTEYFLIITKRGALGTTMQAHSAGDTFTWVEHVIHLMYGNSAATDPSLADASYDYDKPVFDLSQSTNAAWIYTASTIFYDPLHPTRPGSWVPYLSRYGLNTKFYNVKGDAETGDPALGMKVASYQKGTTWAVETAKIGWSLFSGMKFSSVSATGRKYRSTTAWITSGGARLERSDDQSSYTTVWSELTPTATTTWETITKNSQALSPNMKCIRFYLGGSLPASAGVENYLEILTVTVNFVSGNVPTGTLLGEKVNYLLRAMLTNLENDDTIYLQFPMLLNKELIVDGEEHLITFDGVNAISSLSLDDGSRSEWLRLLPGGNTLEITGADVGMMTLGLSWYERRI